MKNNKTILIIFVLIIILGLFVYLFYFKNKNVQPINNPVTPLNSLVTYNNTDYGFTFSLPNDWKGYTIVKNTWQGSPINTTTAETGPKIIIRNPKWTTAVPYEDLPILIFTTSQWNSYVAENFSIGAAPIKASELARNNKYVFALPARWDFDYSLGYQEAESIIQTNPLHSFNL